MNRGEAEARVKDFLECTDKACESLENLRKQAREMRKQFDGYKPESDLVKHEVITYTGSLKDFVRIVLPLFQEPGFRVNGKRNREAMTRILHEVFEVRPDGCEEPRSYHSLLALIQEACSRSRE